jgi:hypothetical protein
MPDPGRVPVDQHDPDELARTERFIDALAACQPVGSGDAGDPGDRALAGLLEDWRDELRRPAPSTLCPEPEAVAALHRAVVPRRRARRGLALIGSVAATLLGIGGFGAMVGDARPGDALYGVNTMLFGEPPLVHDDRIVLSAKTDLDRIQQMIAQGEWDQAQDKLAAVSDSVQNVNDSYRKQDLIDQLNVLNIRVANRDPHATLSPSSLTVSPNSLSVAPSSLSDPGVDPVTGTTSPVTGAIAEPTASATTSDAPVTAVSSPPSTTDPTTSPAATSPPVVSSAPAISSTLVTGVTTTPTALLPGDSGATTQQPSPTPADATSTRRGGP